MATTVKLKKVILSYPRLFVPSAYQNKGTPKYSTHLIMEVGSEAHKLLQAAVIAEAKAAWGDKHEAILKLAAGKTRVCLRDGSEKLSKTGDKSAEYDGKFYVSASNKGRPLLVSKEGKEVSEDDGSFSPLSTVNAIVEVWAYGQGGEASVNATLRGVHLVKSGSAVASISDFSDCIEVESAEESSDELAALLR